jgi:hypothetical protein
VWCSRGCPGADLNYLTLHSTCTVAACCMVRIFEEFYGMQIRVQQQQQQQQTFAGAPNSDSASQHNTYPEEIQPATPSPVAPRPPSSSISAHSTAVKVSLPATVLFLFSSCFLLSSDYLLVHEMSKDASSCGQLLSLFTGAGNPRAITLLRHRLSCAVSFSSFFFEMTTKSFVVLSILTVFPFSSTHQD